MIAGEVAAKIGVKAALAERHRVGGDCLWTGCVPSKALLASAKAAHTMRHADKYGLAPAEIEPGTASVWRRIRDIQQEIAATDDNQDKYAELRGEGVDVQLSAELISAEREGGEKVVRGRVGGEDKLWSAEEVLVAAGRTPNIDSLGLESVGIKTGPRGIVVDDKLRTRAGWVYAAGDCAGRYLFTHSAAAEAVTALRNMFFPGSASAPEVVPWTTFTDPELAHVGLTAGEARKKLGRDNVRVFEWDLSHSDRARAEGATEGQIIAVTDAKLRIVGTHILAPAAGEIISQFTLAVTMEMRLTPVSGDLR